MLAFFIVCLLSEKKCALMISKNMAATRRSLTVLFVWPIGRCQCRSVYDQYDALGRRREPADNTSRQQRIRARLVSQQGHRHGPERAAEAALRLSVRAVAFEQSRYPTRLRTAATARA